jgi:hypothetical protein
MDGCLPVYAYPHQDSLAQGLYQRIDDAGHGYVAESVQKNSAVRPLANDGE